jgi:1,2-phenylacetyl-CoA epoxidase PaaB subunit
VLLWHNSELVSRQRRDLYSRLVAALAGADPERALASARRNEPAR